MSVQLPNPLARALRGFFADHLPRLRGLSSHTVQSYRDSLVLLLRFVAAQHHCSVATLDFDDITTSEVIGFLAHLEEERGNAISTRNVRLAAIHAFFRYATEANPARLEHCQRVLAIPFKRSVTRLIEYLEHEEITAVLAAINRSTIGGRRDYA
ncbi:MAG: site-specific integrase, partial [Chloroflexi bacterium]|nr:site-specific integrase [Chloroflexota bacterium]